MLRAVSVGLLALAFAGCEAFEAHQDTVARAGGQTLTVQRMSELVGNGKVVPLRLDALSRVADLWVDYTLLAHALVAGDSLEDSATVAAVAWPDLAQVKMDLLHDRLAQRVGPVRPESVDSTYAAGELRYLQHILIAVQQSDAPPVKAERRREAEQIRRQAAGAGATVFARLASQRSDDAASKVRGGALGLEGRGRYVPQFEEAGWALAPGAVSGVVESTFGFHIIRRPPLSEVRDSFRVALQDRLANVLDSAFVDSVGEAYDIQVESDAPAAVRAALSDFYASRYSSHRLAGYRGGRFTVGDLIQFLQAYPAQVVQNLPQQTDEVLKDVVRQIARTKILIGAIDGIGVQVPAEELRKIGDDLEAQLGFTLQNVGFDRSVLGDTTRPEAERMRLVTAALDQYLDRLVQGQARFVPVNPFLADVLRQRYRWSVSPGGLQATLDRAQDIRAAADSLQRQLQPAPGPAPVPQLPPGGGAGQGQQRR